MSTRNLHPAIPLSACYLAVLEEPKVGASKRDEARRYAFEEVLPLPVEDLHCIFLDVGERRVLAMGVPLEVVRSAQADGATTLSLDAQGSKSWPEFVRDAVGVGTLPDPASINFLVGPFEPITLARARGRFRVMAAAAVILLTTLLVVGLERQRAHNDQLATQAREAARQIREAAAPAPPTIAAGSIQPASIRLTAELRRLRMAADMSAQPAQSFDAAATLEALLTRWPRELPARTDRVSVAASSVAVSTTLADHDAARELAAAVDPLPGWTLAQPQITAAKEGTQLRLQFNPAVTTPGTLPSASPTPTGGTP